MEEAVVGQDESLQKVLPPPLIGPPVQMEAQGCHHHIES